MGFQEIFAKIEQQDGVKVAAARNGGGASAAAAADQGEPDESIKVASFYDHLGRQLAHLAFDDLVKQAGQEDRQTKVASVLKRMANDPAYAASLVKKHGHLIGQ